MFKEILQKSIVGFFFGLGLAVSVTLIFTIYDQYRYKIKNLFGPNAIHYVGDSISDLTILKHKQRMDTENYTVVGYVKNVSETLYKSVDIRIDIMDGEFILGSCYDQAQTDIGKGYFNAGDTGNFIISCRELSTSGNKYPYKIYIDSAVGLE